MGFDGDSKIGSVKDLKLQCRKRYCKSKSIDASVSACFTLDLMLSQSLKTKKKAELIKAK
jgi:hypothetical protein